jgi:hypothetical protein
MRDIVALLSTVGLFVVAIFILIGIVIYSIRLQRRAVVTQTAVVDDHFAEKTQRQRQYALMEQSYELQKQAADRAGESLEILKRAAARDDEARELLRRSVQASEEILAVLRAPKS